MQPYVQVEGMQVHANEGGVTQTRGGIYWLILPAGCNTLLLFLDGSYLHAYSGKKWILKSYILGSLIWISYLFVHKITSTFIIIIVVIDLGSSFWGMVLVLASTNLLTAKIAAGCFIAALLIVLFIAKNVWDQENIHFES